MLPFIGRRLPSHLNRICDGLTKLPPRNEEDVWIKRGEPHKPLRIAQRCPHPVLLGRQVGFWPGGPRLDAGTKQLKISWYI